MKLMSYALTVTGIVVLCGMFWASVWEGTQCVGRVFCF